MRDYRFFKLVQKFYAFLVEDYGFALIYKRRDTLALYVYYASPTTGVYLTLDRMDTYVTVSFFVLPDMKPPNDRASEHGYPLEYLVQLHCPNMIFEPESQTPDDMIEEYLAMTSDAVRECARDVLQGESSVLAHIVDRWRERQALLISLRNE